MHAGNALLIPLHAFSRPSVYLHDSTGKASGVWNLMSQRGKSCRHQRVENRCYFMQWSSPLMLLLFSLPGLTHFSLNFPGTQAGAAVSDELVCLIHLLSLLHDYKTSEMSASCLDDFWLRFNWLETGSLVHWTILQVWFCHNSNLITLERN